MRQAKEQNECGTSHVGSFVAGCRHCLVFSLHFISLVCWSFGIIKNQEELACVYMYLFLFGSASRFRFPSELYRVVKGFPNLP